MNNKGAILPTVMLCLFLTCTLILVGHYSIQTQASKKHILEDSYRLKSMFNMTEHYLLEAQVTGQDYDFVFNLGKVHAKYHSPTHYQLTGTLDNGFQSSKIMPYTIEEDLLEEEDELEIEQVTIDEGHQIKKKGGENHPSQEDLPVENQSESDS